MCSGSPRVGLRCICRNLSVRVNHWVYNRGVFKSQFDNISKRSTGVFITGCGVSRRALIQDISSQTYINFSRRSQVHIQIGTDIVTGQFIGSVIFYVRVRNRHPFFTIVGKNQAITQPLTTSIDIQRNTSARHIILCHCL